MLARGFATSLPAKGGAEPWTGSNKATRSRRVVCFAASAHARMNVGARGHPEPALQCRTEVGDDVPEQVACHDHFELRGIAHEFET